MSGRESRPRRFLGATRYGWLERIWMTAGIVVSLALVVFLVAALFASAWGPALAWLVLLAVFVPGWLLIGMAAGL